MVGNRHSWSSVRAFLTALAGNTRGNTLAIMAIAIIPLAGMVGGGIDISRMYIVKTRLQHGCDAGALAGRKAMGGGNWVQKVNGVDNYPDVTAKQFFDSNFDRTAYGGTNATRSFTENAGKVSGTATAIVPMTLMRVFGRTSESLTVTCDAEMRLPNTDVMFVLDVTGSMSSKAVSSDAQTKIEALRSAVKCFYEIVARLDTDEDCKSTPSGGVGNEVQVRFGFVPYDMNANVGRLLPTSYFADQWPYQSRERITAYGVWNRWDGNPANTTWSAWQNTGTEVYAANSNACNDSLLPIPADQYALTGSFAWPDSESATEWRSTSGADQTNYRRVYGSNKCYLQKRTRTTTRRAYYTRTTQGAAGAYAFPAWSYKQVTLNVAGLKSGSDWNAGVTMPTGNNHTDVSVAWEGCIEERATVRQASYMPIPEDAHDLDIDKVPTSDPTTQWAPALNPVVFPRRDSFDNSGVRTLATVNTFYQNYSSKSFTCPTAAKKLQKWDNASAFDTYVDSMWGGGNTYHDIGLIWGARLLSPTGIFRAENQFTPAGGEIQRHMIFMTDGESCTSVQNYQAYGIAWYDRRQTDPSAEPTEGCATTGTLTQQVNARTAALCKEIQNKNITLWVIWFGAANATIEGQLKECAKPGNRYFTARNQDELRDNFRKIATEISQLRLTK